jgi:hypothetical protein
MIDVGALLAGAPVRDPRQRIAQQLDGTESFRSLLDIVPSQPRRGTDVRTIYPVNPIKKEVPKQAIVQETPKDEDESPPELATLVTQALSPPGPTPQADIVEIDMEVNDVVFPSGLKAQDELMDLVAQLLGEEEYDDFSYLFQKYIPQEANILAPQDLRKVLTDLVEGLKAEIQTPVVTQRVAMPVVVVSPILLRILTKESEVASTPVFTQDHWELIQKALETAQFQILPPESESLEASVLLTPILEPGELPIPVEVSEDIAPLAIVSPEQELSTPALEPEPQSFSLESGEAKKEVKTDPAPIGSSAPAPVFDIVVETPQEAEIQPTQILQQIVDRLEVAQSDTQNANRLEVQLTPEHLGKLNIVLQRTGDGLTAVFKSANESTRNLLSQNIAQLQESLKASGIDMKHITVEQSEIAWDFTRNDFFQKRESQQPAQPSKRPIRIGSVSPSGLTEGALALAMYGSSQTDAIPANLSDVQLDLWA